LQVPRRIWLNRGRLQAADPEIAIRVADDRGAEEFGAEELGSFRVLRRM
jgi:hypothetical protein